MGVRALLPAIEADILRRAETDRQMSMWTTAPWTRFKRLNQHFERQRSLYGHFLEALRVHGEETNDERLLAVIERAAGVLALAEAERVRTFFRGPRAWEVLHLHSFRQAELTAAISKALSLALGRSITIVDDSQVVLRDAHSPAVPFVLFRDINRHFSEQALAEDQIVAHLRALA